MALQKKILIVEDDIQLASLLKKYLEQEFFKVEIFSRSDTVLSELQDGLVSLVILDIMLPGDDGLVTFRKIRSISDVPIVFLTAKVEIHDRLLGLEMGADDYICKPFVFKEVVARVKAVLRRASPKKQDTKLVLGPISIDSAKYCAKALDVDICLTRAEFSLLRILTGSPGKVFTRSDLITKVWGTNHDSFDRTIDTHISNIRRKISNVLCGEKIINTVYGIGYSFNIPQEYSIKEHRT